VAALLLLLPGLDLALNLAWPAPGVRDFLVLSAFARCLGTGLWPGNSYFPAGYPLLLALSAQLGSMLAGSIWLAWAGMVTALGAAYRLLRLWTVSLPLALLAIVLIWLLPETRIVSCEAYVDSLFDGLGLVFLAVVFVIYHAQPPQRCPRWAAGGLLGCCALLPLLRHHALLLILPVLLVLLATRRHTWRLALAGLLLSLAMLVFNAAGFRLCYGHWPPSTWQTYVRVGLALDQPGQRAAVQDAEPEQLLRGYAALATHSRQAALTDDYSWRELASHVLRQWWQFLRRPAVLLGLGLCVLAAWRRRLAPGMALAALWMVLYSLCLSVCYFNIRNGFIQVMVGAILAIAAAARLGLPQRWQAWPVAAGMALLLAYAGTRFPSRCYAWRHECALVGYSVEDYMQSRGLKPQQIVVKGWPLIPLHANPQALPYARLDSAWESDPAIPRVMLTGLPIYNSDALLTGQATPPPALVIRQPCPSPAAKRLLDSGSWRLVFEAPPLQIYEPLPAKPGRVLYNPGMPPQPDKQEAATPPGQGQQ
jgi:hypothetical protein